MTRSTYVLITKKIARSREKLLPANVEKSLYHRGKGGQDMSHITIVRNVAILLRSSPHYEYRLLGERSSKYRRPKSKKYKG